MKLNLVTRFTSLDSGCLVVIWGLSIGISLGSSSRLTYHEAFIVQGAREILASGLWWYPTIGGCPWLEKPPLPFWLVAGLGWCMGDVSPLIARLPSAVAALGLAIGVSKLTRRRYGPGAGILAGAIQVTTGWTVLRGRLAEADILLACLISWTLLAFDHLRTIQIPAVQQANYIGTLNVWRSWRWVFFGLLGIMSLVKGTGFGAVLVFSVVLIIVLWEKDHGLRCRLHMPIGWLIVAAFTFTWPLAMVCEHGFKVVGLWVLHISERLNTGIAHGIFARESWGEYELNVLGQGLPWTPVAVVGMYGSVCRAFRVCAYTHFPVTDQYLVNQSGGDRLLWAWSLGPLILVSLASGRNAHYAIYAMIPWSIWSALGLSNLGSWLIMQGWSTANVRRLVFITLVGLATTYGLSFWLIAPWLDHRVAEWSFYAAVTRQVPRGEPLALLYDDWDREPYPTPFGPIPHDLALRLYYLERPVCWHFSARSLADHEKQHTAHLVSFTSYTSIVVIGRDHDLPTLKTLGPVEVLDRALSFRWDRTYVLARVWPWGKAGIQANTTSQFLE